MNKRRSLLIGLGVGLMAGAALLQLMTYGQRLGETAALPAPLTVEQLRTQAEGQGYALQEIGEQTYSRAQLDEAVAKAKKEAAAGAAGGEKAGGAEVADKPAAGATPAPSKSAGETSVQEGRLGLYVAAGDSLDKVATGLKALGVIQDKAAFMKAAKPYSGKMQVGLSVFQGQITYDEIIAELLRNKN